MISIIILTKNEETDLPLCVNSISWCNDVHVVDSGSTDKTTLIAEQLGAKVYLNPFKSFGDQRNWALDNCAIKHEWILFLDADEHSTTDFRKAIHKAIGNSTEQTAGYYCCGKTMLEERWLKKSDNFPKWQFRLMRFGRARFIDVGHGQKEGLVNGTIFYIKEPYLHFPFSHGYQAWTNKHLVYAKKDAKQILTYKIRFTDLVSKHGSIRNSAIKSVVRSLPGWPLFRFIYSYILRGGFTEGQEGLIYNRKMLWYERLVKKEVINLSRNLSPEKKVGHKHFGISGPKS